MTKMIVGKTSKIPLGKLSKVSSNRKDILVVNIDDGYYALDYTCPHAGIVDSDELYVEV